MSMNWTQLIDDLRKRGETFESIGSTIGCTGAAVRAISNNPEQQPRWHTGDALIKLHSKVMRRYPKIDTHA